MNKTLCIEVSIVAKLDQYNNRKRQHLNQIQKAMVEGCMKGRILNMFPFCVLDKWFPKLIQVLLSGNEYSYSL